MNRSLIILFGVLVVLLLIYLVIDSARDVTSQTELFVKLDTTKIDGFSIKNEQGTINLMRRSGGWCLAEPLDYPADSRFTTDLMKKLSDLQIETFVTEDSAKKSLFGVDTAGVEVAVFQGKDTLAHFIVGNTSQNYRHTYCRMVGGDKIYLIKGTFTGQLKRKEKDWRNKVILEMDKDSITEVNFVYPEENFTVAKSDTGWTLSVKGETKPVDEKVINRSLSIISRFRTFDFVDGDSARAVDFSLPDLILSVNTDVGDTYKVSLVPQDEDANRYLVSKEGVGNTLFVIYKATANQIMKRAVDFEVKENK